MKSRLLGAVLTGTGIAILLALGTWQLERRDWKTDIIDRLETAYAQGGTEDGAPLDLAALDVAGPSDFHYGTVTGRLARDKAVLLGPRTDDGRAGYDLLVPLAVADGRYLIVDTGWVSDLWQDNIEERLASLPQEPVAIRGLARRADWSRFTSRNSPSRDLWFRADVGEIAAARDLAAPYPVILYADRAEPEFHDVRLHDQGWLPRNKHLQYAIFWYAMAAALAGVYIAARFRRT